MVDYYAVLGLKPGATSVQVKARFRHLAMAVHPDRNSDDSGCQERLKNINAAYEFLSDAGRKADYDARCSAHAEAGFVAPVRASRDSRAARLLTLVALCAFLAGLIVAAVLLAGSTQSAGSPNPVPAVMVIELPSPGEGAAVPPRESGTAADPPLPSPPPPGQTLWPSDLSGPLSAPPDPNGVAPTSDPNLAMNGALPAQNGPVTH